MLAKTILIAIASSIGLVAASNEGVYLVNGDSSRGVFSEMAYYSNARGASQNGQQPDAAVAVNEGAYVTWEGRDVCGTFEQSGETFCSTINGNAASLSTGAFAGTGHNNEQKFNCFKDNGRVLYRDNDLGIEYKSIYYCFDQ